MAIYKLVRAEKVNAGFIKHSAIMPGGQESEYQYQSVRIGLVFPTVDNPSYFVVGGMEIDDPYFASERGLVRVIGEVEIADLSLDSLFNAVTDSYTSMLCDQVYMDFAANEDYRMRFWNYLDQHNLRTSLLDVPYKDVVLRFSLLRDFNDSGNLAVDKGSVLYQDLQSVSKESLRDNPESKFYRLNALSFLIAGFEKYKPVKPLRDTSRLSTRRDQGWML